MQNYEQIFEELGIEVPEDKRADLKKKMSENYKTIADYNKQVSKRDKTKEALEEAQNRLAEFENEDATGLKEQIDILTKQIEEEREARTSENKRYVKKEAVNNYLANKEFINDITRNSVSEKMLNTLLESEDTTPEEAYNAITAEYGVNNLLNPKSISKPRFVYPNELKGKQKTKGYDKLKAMSLDERIALRQDNPKKYAEMVSDR